MCNNPENEFTERNERSGTRVQKPALLLLTFIIHYSFGRGMLGVFASFAYG